ncbi:hypothetical protein [Geomicrobium sp. JCM 19039]|nr:hypothetical protein [Geomicrobium sp. JCM 19039]
MYVNQLVNSLGNLQEASKEMSPDAMVSVKNRDLIAALWYIDKLLKERD